MTQITTRLSILFVGLALAASQRAQAQTTAPADRSIDIQIFQPAIGPNGFFTVESATVPEHLQWSLGVSGNYQSKPFSLSQVDGAGAPKPTIDAVRSMTSMQLGGAIGLLGKAQVGLALPVILTLDGQGFNTDGSATGQTLSGAGIGDPRIEAKYLLSQNEFSDSASVFVSALGGISLPLGDSNKFTGDKSLTGRVKVLTEIQSDDFRIGGYVGALLRAKSSTVFAAETGHQLLFGVAAEYNFHPQVGAVGEIFGRNGFSRWVDQAPTEGDLGLRVKVTPMLSATLGGGAGIIKGIGAPAFRGFALVDFHPNFSDADQDGIYDANDRCPNDKEDHDGYKDSDGCPELDNDGDTVFDADDKCPNEAEDPDGFEDDDGCPELDNDKDGVPDLHDACPNASEDGAGKRPTDGCPSTSEDTDGDGVVDAKDKCPEEPEDRDGFQDYDGCPEDDNDNDGIPDNFDSCPDEAEDADGFDDDDGCPEPDNDKDGFSDAEDKCPNEAETLNGNKDDDGCPDAGTEVVVLEEASIVVRERIVLRGGKVVGPAAEMIKLIALLLKGHSELASVRIESASNSEAMGAGHAEAVKAALVAAGVDGQRLKTSGITGRPNTSFIVEHIIEPKGSPPADEAARE